MNVRRSAHVVLTWHSSGAHAEAFALLTGERVTLSRERVANLLAVPQDELVSRDERWVEELCQKGLFLTDRSDGRSEELRRREVALEELGWDFESAFFHLSKRFEGARGKSAPPAELVGSPFREIEAREQVELPLPQPESELQRLLLERRTHRDFAAGAITLEQLSALLRFVWGAHGYGRDRSGAPVLAKTSPSGGSLHPIEAYPLLARVEGVEAGLYHYSVRRHALELMEQLSVEAVRDLVAHFTAGQDWFEAAQALFLVTARFERSYAKYRHDHGAYQSLLLEAGHFSQAFYLVATDLGLGPFVTSVINHADIDRRLGLDPYAEGVLAICGCGLPAASPDVVHDRPFVPRETELEA